MLKKLIKKQMDIIAEELKKQIDINDVEVFIDDYKIRIEGQTIKEEEIIILFADDENELKLKCNSAAFVYQDMLVGFIKSNWGKDINRFNELNNNRMYNLPFVAI